MKQPEVPCGFECKFSNDKSVRSFFDLACADLGKLYVNVIDNIVFHDGERDFTLPTTTNVLVEFINTLIQRNFWAVGLVWHVYPKETPHETIDTYSDFLQSSCEMIFLLYDVCYLEVYCKNQAQLAALAEKAKAIPDTRFEMKYPSTDARYEMYV